MDVVTKAAEILFQQASAYLSVEDLTRVRQAFLIAQHAHSSQTRQSGEPYITHPIAVAHFLTEWKLDVDALCAGLLHDVLEDTNITKQEIVADFGPTVGRLVDGLSKLERLNYQSQELAQAENLRKMVLAMVDDIRIILIKLADRLHNMRTLMSMRPDKQKKIAQETLEIYAPIANRMGLYQTFRELQELSFRYLHPYRYRVLSTAVWQAKKKRIETIHQVTSVLSLRLAESQIEAVIFGREKSTYSIYKKMRKKSLSFSEVLDVYGFRIIVPDMRSCYWSIGTLHALYKPIPGRFKDYIAIPKGNGYQSLHTTLFGPQGIPIEIQVRTREMHRVAETGIASHWLYKEDQEFIDSLQEKTHQWIQRLLVLHGETDDAQEFLEHMKVDLFPDEVYVFTPQGKILVLPRGATPIDFAFAIHSDVGFHCVGAKVNQVSVSLFSKLRSGDTVEIFTSTDAHPDPSWLGRVVSGRARAGIRSYLKTLREEESVQLGRFLLRQALLSFEQDANHIERVLKKPLPWHGLEHYENADAILSDVGTGKLLPIVVAQRLLQQGEHMALVSQRLPLGLTLDHLEHGSFHLGPCCQPLPLEAILGLFRKGQGLVLHRATCPIIQQIDIDKRIRVHWHGDDQQFYPVGLQVMTYNVRGAFAMVAQAIAEAGGNLERIETPEHKDAHQYAVDAYIKLRLNLRDANQLQEIVSCLKALELVREVLRVTF